MTLLLLLLFQESRIMVESAQVYEAVGKTGAAGFRSPQQTVPNTPVSNSSDCLICKCMRCEEAGSTCSVLLCCVMLRCIEPVKSQAPARITLCMLLFACIITAAAAAAGV